MSIYNQGYYDGIFELPISKVFFLLRYAIDDNTPAMLEESAKALSALFYNETDEVILNYYSIKSASPSFQMTVRIQCIIDIFLISIRSGAARHDI